MLLWLGCEQGVQRATAATGSGEYLIDVKPGGERGLRNSSVTAITQTADGYLWIGTYDGLARYDGERFVFFDPQNTPGLRYARIRRLYNGPDQALWICAHDGSISRMVDNRFTLEWGGEGAADSAPTLLTMRSNRPVFMLRTGEFIRWRPEGGTNRWELLKSPGASAGQTAVEAGDGVIWSCGRDQKIYWLDGSNFKALPGNGGISGEVSVLVADGRGQIWAGSDHEVAVWDGSKFETMTPTNGEPVINVNFLRVLDNGDIWTIANERVRRARGREWNFEVEQARGLFGGWRERTGLHEDAKHGVWFYDYGRGAIHIRPDGRVRQITAEEDFPPGERVDSFYEDREGNVWMGVDRGGLVRIREKRFNVLAGESAAAKITVCVAEDNAGAIWIGTFGGGLHRWFNDEWQVFSLRGGARRDFVFSVVPDMEGRLWASAGDEDLYVGIAGRFTPFSPEVHGVKALLRAQDGRIWVGRKSGLGVVSNGQFRQYYPDDGVARTEIRALAESADGAIWAGAGDGLLTRVATNGITYFRATDSGSNQPIWSLYADANGVVWAGTYRGGLLRLQNGHFTRYTLKDGLPDDVICQILDDGAGRLWFGSKQGVFNANKTELELFAANQIGSINCTAYGRYDGLPSLLCSDSYQPAAWRTRDGRLLFTTQKGVVAVKAGEVSMNPLPPPVLIESVVIDGVEQKPEANVGGPFGRAVTPLRVVVGPGKQQVRIQFTGLSFVSPDRVRFKYKMEDLDQGWSEASTIRFAQYNLLPPGEHRFVVKACNNDGVWNESGAALLIVVQPHFYERWEAKALATVGGIVLVVFAVRRIYVRRYRQKLEQVERQRAIERDRARIAKDIHDDLGAGLTHITLLSELAQRDTPQQLPHHVGQISEMARELTRSMDEIVWAIDPHNDTLDSLVTYVSKFAQEYLSVAQIRCRLDVPPELPVYSLPAEVRHNLFLTIKEALNNVVKHARASEAWLRVVVQPSSFSVIIEDNGRGFAARKEADGSGRADRISSGHGLENMKRRLSAIGGECKFSSPNGAGTRVELSVNWRLVRSPELVTGSGEVTG